MIGTYVVDPKDDCLGDNLRRLIKERGMTQREFSELADLPANTVRAFVKKRRSPTLYSLRKLQHALGCTWDELLGYQ